MAEKDFDAPARPVRKGDGHDGPAAKDGHDAQLAREHDERLSVHEPVHQVHGHRPDRRQEGDAYLGKRRNEPLWRNQQNEGEAHQKVKGHGAVGRCLLGLGGRLGPTARGTGGVFLPPLSAWRGSPSASRRGRLGPPSLRALLGDIAAFDHDDRLGSATPCRRPFEFRE